MPTQTGDNEYRQDTADILVNHYALVDKLKSDTAISTSRVEAAFLAVPRHHFLPQVSLEKVYSDRAIPTKFEDGRAISSSSQPAMMAIMLEQLDLQPGHRVLEVGAGTGYNAALMAHIVGNTGQVTTVDIDEDTAAAARACLDAAGFRQVNVVCGDGMAGYAADAPYDRIILTVGGWDVPPAWSKQLQSDGRLLMPLSVNGPQLSVAFDRIGEHFVSVSIRPCSFMRLRGDLAESEIWWQYDSEPQLCLGFIEQESFQVDAKRVYEWLTTAGQDWKTGLKVTSLELLRSFNFWLAFSECQQCTLAAQGETGDQAIVPYLYGGEDAMKWCSTNGILTDSGISLLMRSPESLATEGRRPFELLVRSFGPDHTVAHRLIDQVRAWHHAGRPGIEGLRIRAYAIDTDFVAAEDQFVVAKKWHKFVFDWP